MLNQIDARINSFMEEILSHIRSRLANSNDNYKINRERLDDLYDTIDKSLMGQNTIHQKNYPEVLQEYMNLDEIVSWEENTAVYFQGIFDAIHLMLRLGWMKKDNL